jgi:phosphatidyl-myo-inositol dimannoside synthase
MNGSVLFLTLRVFSATGGIEKVCRIFAKVISELGSNASRTKSEVLSMYDASTDADSRYLGPLSFVGFGKKKLSFVVVAIYAAWQSQVIVLSHINLLSVGFLIKLLRPRVKLVMFAHGIEVWSRLPRLRRWMMKKVDRVWCVSQFTLDKLATVNQVPTQKLSVLNNCLDPFLPLMEKQEKEKKLIEKYQLAPDDTVLFTLTRLSGKELYKGYDNVIRTLPGLLTTQPGIKYIIAGKYDADEKERIGKLIAQLGLGQHVVLAGYIADADLPAYFGLADIYIMPSQKEGFGISFIEAMYYGVPVIAGNKDGSRDALLNGELGLLVNPDSLDEITTAISKMMSNSALYMPNSKKLNDNFSYEVYKQNVATELNKLMLSNA